MVNQKAFGIVCRDILRTKRFKSIHDYSDLLFNGLFFERPQAKEDFLICSVTRLEAAIDAANLLYRDTLMPDVQEVIVASETKGIHRVFVRRAPNEFAMIHRRWGSRWGSGMLPRFCRYCGNELPQQIVCLCGEKESILTDSEVFGFIIKAKKQGQDVGIRTHDCQDEF